MSLTTIGVIVAAVIGFVAAVFGYGHKSGTDSQKAKEQKARNDNLNRIKNAADAGARVQPDDPGVVSDPHDLDR